MMKGSRILLKKKAHFTVANIQIKIQKIRKDRVKGVKIPKVKKVWIGRGAQKD
jgi:hypothetical protein